MNIQIYSIRIEGKRTDAPDVVPNSKDIIHAQGVVNLHLLRKGYTQGVATTQIKKEGFGHGFPYMCFPYSGKQVQIDNTIYFNPKTNSGVLEVSFAIRPARLDILVEDIIENSGLPVDKWERDNYGKIIVSDEFPRDPWKVSVRDIMKMLREREEMRKTNQIS